MESDTVKTAKPGRNLEIVKLYAFDRHKISSLATQFELSDSRVLEIIWNFLEHRGYKPVLHPGRLSANLVFRVVPRDKLLQLYLNRPNK